MVHQPRRTTTRLAGMALCGMIAVALVLGAAGPLTAAGTSAEPATMDTSRATATGLGADTLPIYTKLRQQRTKAGLAELALDQALTKTARRDACALARGELQLAGTETRRDEAGAQRENVGLVVDEDRASAARTMHAWWMRQAAHRADRMDPDMRRYGVGACGDGERTYYVERFAL